MGACCEDPFYRRARRLVVGMAVTTPDGPGIVVRIAEQPGVWWVADVEVLHDDRAVGLGGYRVFMLRDVKRDESRMARRSAWTVLDEERAE